MLRARICGSIWPTWSAPRRSPCCFRMRTRSWRIPTLAVRFPRIPAFSYPPPNCNKRLELHVLAAESCWNQLFAHCELLPAVETFQDANIPKCEALIERIVEDPVFAKSRESEVCDLLANTESRPNDSSEWLVGLLIMLAGRLRLAETVPDIYRHYEVDWDWYNEENLAIARADRPPKKCKLTLPNDSPKNHGTSATTRFACSKTSTPKKVQTHVAALLEHETDDLLRCNLGVAAASHFDDAGIEVARSVFLEDPRHVERQTIIELLVAHSYLAELDLPEQDQWEQELHRDWARLQQKRRTRTSTVEHFPLRTKIHRSCDQPSH